MDAILTCQGGGYTESIHPQLRAAGWKGYWIDAASTLRMAENTIILDPVNHLRSTKPCKRVKKILLGAIAP